MLSLQLKCLKADAEGVWAFAYNTELPGPLFLQVWKNSIPHHQKLLHEWQVGRVCTNELKKKKKKAICKELQRLGPECSPKGY